MKIKLLTALALISFISLSAHAEVFDKRSAEAGVLAGMYIQKNKEDILSWSRLIAYKTLENEAKKYDCEHKVNPSTNGASEYIRGLCTFVNQDSKKEVLEGLNALAFGVLHTYEDKKDEALCASSLALFTTRNDSMASKLANQSHGDSELCKTAKNIVKLGLEYEMKYHDIEAGNVCVGK